MNLLEIYFREGGYMIICVLIVTVVSSIILGTVLSCCYVAGLTDKYFEQLVIGGENNDKKNRGK